MTKYPEDKKYLDSMLKKAKAELGNDIAITKKDGKTLRGCYVDTQDNDSATRMNEEGYYKDKGLDIKISFFDLDFYNSKPNIADGFTTGVFVRDIKSIDRLITIEKAKELEYRTHQTTDIEAQRNYKNKSAFDNI